MIDTLSNLAVNTGAFLFALGVIVFVHELGHHLVAKLFGVRVHVFSLGFGKRIWGFRRGDTDYRVSALPLGGYVRLGGELPEEATGDPSEFLSKPRWQRILVYLAGPAMNVVLSVALIAGVFMYGITAQGLQGLDPVIGFVAEDGPAAAAGLQVGDRVLSLDGKAIEEWDDVEFQITTSPERPLELEIDRAGERLSVTLVPTKVPRYEFGDAGVFPRLQLRFSRVLPDHPAAAAGFLSGDAILSIDGQSVTSAQAFVDYVQPRAGQSIEMDVLRDGERMTLSVTPDEVEGQGKIGVFLGIYRPLPFGEAVVESVLYNIDIVRRTGQVLGKLFTAQLSPKSALSGPIEIAAVSGEVARQGFDRFFFFIGFLSISIGIMNLLPIPVLDGGHITILLIESLMRRDLSLHLKERFTQFGLVFLMMLMVVVIFFDISKRLPGLFGS
ncbi:MAG: RIP metalloprotease RseP [Acidobacteriota bacterium]